MARARVSRCFARGCPHAHSLSSGIQGSLDEVWRRSADPDDGRNAQSGNGGHRIVHRVVADVSVLAIDDDTVKACQGYDLRHAHRRQCHEGHEWELMVLKFVQKPQARVLYCGRVGRWVWVVGHR